MLDHVLVFLKNRLNANLNQGTEPADALEDSVNFINGQTMDPLEFKLNSISLLMINMEQENILNPPNRYRQCSPNGVYTDIQPEIRMNLYVLFVALYWVKMVVTRDGIPVDVKRIEKTAIHLKAR